MKNLFKYLFASLLILIMGVHAFAQTRVTGHVFAEIVESSSARSNINTSFYLDSYNDISNFDLGEIAFSGSALSTGSLLVSANTLHGDNGSVVDFFTSINQGESSYLLDETGKQNFKINGSASKNLLTGKDKNYKAEFAVVFAYN